MDINVLVAEKSSKTRKNIVRSLKEIGIQDIQEANTGDQTVDIFSDHRFDVVLVDWELQTQSGSEVVEVIRKLDKDVIIFATTAKADNRSVSALEADQPGISDYLVTPFTTEALREKLDKFAASLTA